MDKVSFDLPQSKWGSLKSKFKPETRYVTSDEFTAGSYNFITNVDGSITKRPTEVLYNPDPLDEIGQDQFEAIFSSGVHHLLGMSAGTLIYTTGDGIMNEAWNGYTATANMEWSMYLNRVYFDNGVDNPGVYDLTTSYGGVTYTFPDDTEKEMGCQPPEDAVTFDADTTGGSVPAGGHTYKVTFLYYGFEESNGGPASALHTVSNPDNTVNVTDIPIGGYGVTARNIYRDDDDGDYRLVGTLSDNTTEDFVDTQISGTTPIPVANDLPPKFAYIALNLSRLWVAGVSGTPTTLYWSSPGLPDIFDPDNSLVCNPKDPIQAIFVYQGVTYVFNRHSFGRVNGATDDDFFYEEFPGSVGCVDNRSIQVRTIDGVPTLIWLSDRGFYKFNGSSADYISDDIEDIVNLNIQQVNFVNGSNNQSTLADFQAGTATPGIDLDSNPGTITTEPTTETFESQEDWEGGSSLDNLATADGTNQLKVPVVFSPTLAAGTLAGSAIISGSNLTLPVGSDFTGQAYTFPGAVPGGVIVSYSGDTAVAFLVSIPTAGTITSFVATMNFSGTARAKVWSNSLGSPSSVLGQSSPVSAPSLGVVTASLSVSVAAGTYWIGIESTASNQVSCAAPDSVSGLGQTKSGKTGGPWVGSNNGSGTAQSAFTFSQTPISSSGTWTSVIHDSYSDNNADSDVVINTGSFPSPSTATIFVDASNDPTMNTGVSTFSQATPNGSYSVGLSDKRYWRIRYSLSSTDDRVVPSVTVPSLRFQTTGTWISPVIDCTTDVTTYNAITITQNVPVGTTVTITVATSPDDITYSSYVDVGSAVVERYVKVKAVLTTTGDNASTPSISLLRFSWNLESTFTSYIINAGQTPSGWGLFQESSSQGAGTITFYMRSAASEAGIPAATFVEVTNGSFPDPTISPLQYTQWRAVLTTQPGTLPSIGSVTINWFLGNNQSPIRTASLFFDKTYYLAAAERNEETNNIVIAYDQEGNWRVFRDLTINSLGLFFNQPFYFDADEERPNLYQWLVEPTGEGEDITLDFRTKAFDLGEPLKLKAVRSLVVSGMNTGTTIHAYYSVDRGTTWIEMLNSSGVVGYTTGTDGNKFNEYFVPAFNPGDETSGVTIMFRVTSEDAFPCSILTLKPELYVRRGRYLGRPL